MKLLPLLITILYLSFAVKAQTEVISLGRLYKEQQKIYQEVFFKNNDRKIKAATITCFEIVNEKDSVQVFTATVLKPTSKRKEFFYSNLYLNSSENGSTFNTLYEDIILKNSSLPCGTYHTYLSLEIADSTVKSNFIQIVDSVLDVRSEVSKKIDELYGAPKEKSFLGSLFSSQRGNTLNNNAARTILKSSNKINKSLGSKGFTVNYRKTPSKTFADVSYKSRFVGYYEVNMKQPLSDNIAKKKTLLSNNPASGVDTRMEKSLPVFSQMKGLHNEKKSQEVIGGISLMGRTSTGQEENSQSDDNYYEVAGKLEIPVMDIPVTINGFYTSQDQHRKIKSSFLRLHYDSEKAKSELLKSIAGYKSKYNDAVSQSNGMGKIYGTYLNSMQGEKDKLWGEIAAETGVTNREKFGTDTAALLRELTKQYPDSPAFAKEAVEKYNKAMTKYRKLQELEKKTQYYSTLLQQNCNNNYFDSVIAYDKLKNIGEGQIDDKSYKQLAKSSKGFLPDDHTKSFITGLNNIDAGIFSKQVSSYTINGQTIKGIDAEYDVNIATAGFTYGRIEYVSRDGQIDKYTGYSGRASFKPGNRQKAALIYYGYMPSRRMLTETKFFDGVDSYMPSFKKPIHIVSALYSAGITKYAKIESEVASSFKNTDEYKKEEVPVNNRMAYNIALEGDIPRTYISLRGSYEHIGKEFENNTLPINFAGTQKYVAGAKGQFFNNFLTLGVEYNHLQQQNFAAQSSSSKWGFDIKTHSKRYPSASLSYKPFTTFRTVSDTLNIPQRPILGEVWLGKLNYQIKKKNYILRLTAVYNKNTALVDTMRSSNNVAQFNAIYTTKKTTYMLTAGQTHVLANTISVVHGKTNFLSIAASYIIGPQWSISGGQDIGVNKTGLSRYAVNLGGGYRFKRVPLSIRSNFRYNTYRLDPGLGWKTIYSCMLNMNWEFRFKMKDHE